MSYEMRIHKVYGYRSFEWLTALSWCSLLLIKKKRKHPRNKYPPLTLPRWAPYVIVSSTNSKAQAPNLNNAPEAFPTGRVERCLRYCVSGGA